MTHLLNYSNFAALALAFHLLALMDVQSHQQTDRFLLTARVDAGPM